MTIQEAVQLINQLITCGSFNRSRELLKDNLSQLDEVFFDVLRDFTKEVERVGQKETAELLAALNKEAHDLLEAKELEKESGSPSSLFDLFTSLAQQVTQGNLSLDKAVGEINEIVSKRPVLVEQTVTMLNVSIESLANQSPPLAYNLAYLTHEAAKVIDNRLLRGISSLNLGNLSLHLARFSHAIVLYRESLPLFDRLNNKQVIGIILGNLGIAYHSLGQYQKSVDYFQDALKIAKEIGDRESEGNHLGNLGNTYCALGRYRKAIDYFQDALITAKEIGFRKAEGAWLGSLGNVYRSLGQYWKAIEYFDDGLKIAKEIGDREGYRGVRRGRWCKEK